MTQDTSSTAVFGALLLAFALIAAACNGTNRATDDASTITAAAATAAPTTTRVPDTTAAPATTTAGTTAAESTTTTASTEAPGRPYGGEAIMAADQEPVTLNPFLPGGDDPIVSMIGQGYLAGVQELDGSTLTPIPELVSELPTVANGGVTVNANGTMTVRYTIRDEAVWSDGTPISGADFQFTLDTILDPRLPVDRKTYEDIVETGVGDKTFSYTLAAPTTRYEQLFGTLIPKHAVEGSDFTRDWNDTMWPSAGPFVLEQWQKGEFLKLARNDNYWKSDPDTGQALPYLDSVTFRFIPETEIIEAFRVREVDIIAPDPLFEPVATTQSLQALEARGATVEVLSGPLWEHLNFQFGDGRLQRNPTSANDNLNYRKAVAFALDRQMIADEILAGRGEPLDSFVELYVPTLSQGSWAQYNYDPATARSFVEAAKLDLGVDTIEAVFSTTANNDARVKLSELLVPMFADAGIDYVNDLEAEQIFVGDTVPFGLWDLGEWAWISSPGLSALTEMFDRFDPEMVPPDGQNFYRWGTPEVRGQGVGGFNQGASSVIDDNTTRFAEIHDLLHLSVDTDALVPLIAEAETILAEQVVIIPLFARLVTAAVWSDEIGGFKHNPTKAGPTWNMESWYRVG